MRTPRLARTAIAALSFVAAGAAARTAAASDDEAILAGAAVLGFGAADMVFANYDVLHALRGERPSRGWAIAETAVTAPQAIVLNVVVAVGAGERDGDIPVTWLLLPTIGVTAMSMHGSLSAGVGRDDLDPAAALGFSFAIATDLALTAGALGPAVRGELAHRGPATAAIVLSLPVVALGGYFTARDDENRAAWVALTAWSSALLVHGAVSLLKGRDDVSAALPLRLSPALVGGAPGVVAAGAL